MATEADGFTPFPNVVFGGSVTTEKQSSSSWIRFFISDVSGLDRAEGGERAIFPTLSASRTGDTSPLCARGSAASLRSWVRAQYRQPPETPSLPFRERDPPLHARLLEGVKEMLRFKPARA